MEEFLRRGNTVVSPLLLLTTSVSLNSGNFPSSAKIKSGVMKDVSPVKTSKSFAADKIRVEGHFFAFYSLFCLQEARAALCSLSSCWWTRHVSLGINYIKLFTILLCNSWNYTYGILKITVTFCRPCCTNIA